MGGKVGYCVEVDFELVGRVSCGGSLEQWDLEARFGMVKGGRGSGRVFRLDPGEGCAGFNCSAIVIFCITKVQYQSQELICGKSF